ncbi:MAG: hypothetical protein HY240_03000 [Actinobacteria bacterium]|nr:hypothetical protein [Actinomycetota bacterium]
MQGMDRLLELQEVDSAVERLMARERALGSGQELAAARAEADAAEAALGELRLSIDALARDQQRLEHEIDSLAQKAAAEEKRLYDGSVANAKELGSLQHEVENLNRRRSDREDEVLAILEEREELETRASEQEAAATSVRARAGEVAVGVTDELARIAEDLGRKVSLRGSLVPLFDPELLELYEEMRAQKKGVGAAALVEGVCQGCHEKLSAMELDKLKRTEGVKRCEYCRRILVL